MSRPILVMVCQAILAGTFLVAAVGKWRDRPGTYQAVADFSVPNALRRPVSLGLPFVEFGAAALLALPTTRVGGAVLAVLLLAAFSAAIVTALRHGRRPTCHCFGARSSQPIGRDALARNLALAALAFVVVVRG